MGGDRPGDVLGVLPEHAGGAYVAEKGSRHTDFETLTPATYISIFKI